MRSGHEEEKEGRSVFAILLGWGERGGEKERGGRTLLSCPLVFRPALGEGKKKWDYVRLFFNLGREG